MGIEDELLKICRESKEYLESISALELIENTDLFGRDLRKLVNNQHLPSTILVGCLMGEIHDLLAEPSNMLFDNKLMESFGLFKKHVDKEFMKKEKL